MKGLVHIYTGNGKGKTTAAIGLGVRACGREKRVLMVQFLKGRKTGEMVSLEKLYPYFNLLRNKGAGKFSWNMTQEELEKVKSRISELFDSAVGEVAEKKYDMLILDEVMVAITSGFIELERVVELIKNKPAKMELVLTGRNAPSELRELADYVSEINPVKHPYERGIAARNGIEF